MKTILVTGCGGLIGRESVEFFLSKGFRVIGIDNNMRRYFFGEDGSVVENIEALESLQNFNYYEIDIRDYDKLEQIFIEYSKDITGIIHTAAQPSHDWAAREPFTDFSINATATLNLLELTRKICPKATFIFTSTNKVYGDNPNYLPLQELSTRYDLPEDHEYYEGIREDFSIDGTKHSLFGCSKVAADVYVQEYGRYFGMNTVVFRGGCLTGSKHKGAELHGFLNYLVKCSIEGRVYTLYGYKGKQVRDNIHSSDLVRAFYEVYNNPKSGEVYNVGGSRLSNCSILEAVSLIKEISGKEVKLNYVEDNRIGDHIWWISSMKKFKKDYPNWNHRYDIKQILIELIDTYRDSMDTTKKSTK
jgi:CDP-paratose 2-epimerase